MNITDIRIRKTYHARKALEGAILEAYDRYLEELDRQEEPPPPPEDEDAPEVL